jgi:hypothetical protein
VHFFRDEMANMVWAVESIVTGGAGAQWPGAERGAALSATRAQPPAGVALRYLIQTPVPYNWIPFLPVTIDPTVGSIALERAAMLDISANPPRPIEPVGRILRPRGGAHPYRIREEEILRSGVRVRRIVCRTARRVNLDMDNATAVGRGRARGEWATIRPRLDKNVKRRRENPGLLFTSIRPSTANVTGTS